MIRHNNQRKIGSINNYSQPFSQNNTHPNQNQNQYSQKYSFPPFVENTKILQNSNWEASQNKPRKRSQKYENGVKQEMPLLSVDLSNQNLINLNGQSNINLSEVSILNLSCNNISQLSMQILTKLQNLTSLNISNNQIQKISFPYSKETKIKDLNLSSNKIVSLNLQHLTTLQKLDSKQNQISFLTLPQSVQILNLKSNNFSNIYFLQKCSLLTEVDLSQNILYDLKFNFRPYIKFQNQSNEIQIKYKFLRSLNCSNNKIQHLEGFIHIMNIKSLDLSQNAISFNRQIINELLNLQNLQNLHLYQNPLEDEGFNYEETFKMICCKMQCIKFFDGEDMSIGYPSSRKQQQYQDKTSVCEEPYQLFMQSGAKIKENCINAQWNFTLGDCEQQNKQQQIIDISNIQFMSNEINHDASNPKSINNACQKINQNIKPENHYIKSRHTSKQKPNQEIKVKLIKSESTLSNNFQYRPFLAELLPFSYIPLTPISKKGSKICSARLSEQSEDFIIIDRMLSSRGGVVYVKKIMQWQLYEQDRYVFENRKSSNFQMGFLMNEMSEKDFRSICKRQTLIQRKDNDVIGSQPHIFSCYHLIVRWSNYHRINNYSCAYAIQTAHL